MNSKKLLGNALIARQKGIINLIVFLVLQVVLKSGGIYFVLFAIGSFLLDYKTMQIVGIGESLRKLAASAFIFGLIIATISLIDTEILYRRRR